MATCPNCGNQIGEGAVFCDQCGTRLPAPEAAVPEPAPAPTAGSVICPACGAGNVPGEAFCDYCGSPLEAPVPTVEQVPELEPVSSEAELEAPPAEVEEPAPPDSAQAEEKPTCPACKAEVLPGEAFCANCGASLAQPPIPPEPVAEAEPVPDVQPEVEEAPAPEAVAEAPVMAEPVEEAAPVAGGLAHPALGLRLGLGDDGDGDGLLLLLRRLGNPVEELAVALGELRLVRGDQLTATGHNRRQRIT